MHRLSIGRSLGAAILAAGVLSACDDGYPVERCVPGRGVELAGEAPRLGPDDAAVWLVMFGDYQCEYSAHAGARIDAYREKLAEEGREDALRLEVRHFPLESIHPRARPAALAAVAAHRQDPEAFWTFHRLLLGASALGDGDIELLAKWAGLDAELLFEKMHSDAVAATVDRDLALAAEHELPGTPAFFLCGARVSSDPEVVLDNIDHLLDR